MQDFLINIFVFQVYTFSIPNHETSKYYGKITNKNKITKLSSYLGFISYVIGNCSY